MKIQITENIHITNIDRMNFALVQTKTVKDTDSENFGKTREEVLGYFSNFENATKHAVKFLLLTDSAITTLEEMRDMLAKTQDEIVGYLRENHDFSVEKFEQKRAGAK
jgi:2,4-dienoyl-CoA reductase-like NADH-dependent reductase (Old Yellow Enzyme family)